MSDTKKPNVLAIAGVHSAAVAGLFTDLKTFAALGCNGLGVVTAIVTANNGAALQTAILDSQLVHDQLSMLTNNYRIGAIKLGYLPDVQCINMLAVALRQQACQNLVLDLVICRQTSEQWLENQALAALTTELVPLATVITPSREEAELLLGCKLTSKEDVVAAAHALSYLHPQAVLIKDFKEAGQVSDCLYITASKRLVWLHHKQQPAPNLLGGGCTLSSAIAAFLALGHELLPAVQLAEAYLQEALCAGLARKQDESLQFSTLDHFASKTEHR